MPGIDQRRQRQRQVVGGEQRGAGRRRKTGRIDGDIARTAGGGNGIDPGATEIGRAGEIESQAAESEAAVGKVGACGVQGQRTAGGNVARPAIGEIDIGRGERQVAGGAGGLP
ncbi:hypothetical protein [Rhizobium leguminosarum]|uniref:hypothetical protein n=1 Tax=Rhizobium leguminosarum TaxID=384 RepID=UPI00315DCEEE